MFTPWQERGITAMDKILQLLGYASDLGVHIPEIYIPRSAYDELCEEGDYDGPAPCPVTVEDEAEIGYTTQVYPADEVSHEGNSN